MGMIANIACKAVGIGGMSLALYDAYSHAKYSSHRMAQAAQADHFERVYSDTRTLNTESHVNAEMQKKVADLRMSNPLISGGGKIKGFFEGLFHSMGENIIPIAFSALAICTKGLASKIGAFGAIGCGLYTILREGFGVGKHSPVE